MFRIDTNWAIRMDKGDDISFPLFLNRGTAKDPVRYSFEKGDGCEVYFYIMKINQNPDCPLIKLTFTSDNDLYVDNYTQKPTGDMLIKIKHEDTCDIPEGEYRYQIKTKLKDLEGNYVINTVTNRLPFYILDSNYDRQFIYR